jgi:hypothetical protein
MSLEEEVRQIIERAKKASPPVMRADVMARGSTPISLEDGLRILGDVLEGVIEAVYRVAREVVKIKAP